MAMRRLDCYVAMLVEFHRSNGEVIYFSSPNVHRISLLDEGLASIRTTEKTRLSDTIFHSFAVWSRFYGEEIDSTGFSRSTNASRVFTSGPDNGKHLFFLV